MASAAAHLPASPLPAPGPAGPPSAAPHSGVAASSLEAVYYFHPHAWFLTRYGRLPLRRIYELPSDKVLHAFRQTLLDWYSDLPARTVAATEFYDHLHPDGLAHWGAYEVAPGLLVFFGTRADYGPDDVQLLYDPAHADAHTTELERLSAHLTTLLQPEKAAEHHQIWVMQASEGDVRFRPLDITLPKLTLETHYNDDLGPIHERLVARLCQPRDKGIVILHGPPGTGKTSYIRHLCGLTTKRKLFIPPNLAPQLADPGFINQLYHNTDSILLIEDAEQLLLRRDDGRGLPGAVSNLLNLSDGLLSDCFHIQIICTFNTDLARIDPALLRKGRLIAAYEFGPLAQAKAAALAASLGQSEAVTTDLTLAELYAREEPEPAGGPPAKRAIGFGAGR